MLSPQTIRQLARECGFELAGIAPAEPPEDFDKYQRWVAAGYAGQMGYLTDRRGDLRRDIRNLLPNARSVICVGKLYNTGEPRRKPGEARISRYAQGRDYHDVMREALEQLVERLRHHPEAPADFDTRVCVDTAPLLERSLARMAGLGWIGKNTCLINEPEGSWFFLGEVITSLDLTPATPPPDRCGSCTRCIDACPTQAIVRVPPAEPALEERWTIDSRRCISYLTIELRGAIPEEHRAGVGTHVFGCDICQEVCPWNSSGPVTAEAAFESTAVGLEEIAGYSQSEFRERFRATPVSRAKYAGLLRNVAVAMGNIGAEGYREALEKLAEHPDALVREHAVWALQQR